MEETESNWEELAAIAKAIAGTSSINSSSTRATVTVNGKSHTINVGDIFKVKYNGEIRRVRVLGFKHDDLVNTKAYGGSHTKAGISFEFYDCMTGTTEMAVNPTNTYKNGWAAAQIRKDLNGYTTTDDIQNGTIGGLGVNLSNKNYIKQVKKKYIKTYNDATSNKQSTYDYLWYLACSEIWPNGVKSGGYGWAVASEGAQYQYYKGTVTHYDYENQNILKPFGEEQRLGGWSLRSPGYMNDFSPTIVTGAGKSSVNGTANSRMPVNPGFCI